MCNYSQMQSELNCMYGHVQTYLDENANVLTIMAD